MKNTRCIHCNQKFRNSDGLTIHVPGDVYSAEGRAETQLSGFCEFCFDEMFGDEDEEDFDV